MQETIDNPENKEKTKNHIIPGKFYLIFALIILFIAISAFTHFKETQKLSIYNYKNFYWANTSTSLIYTRNSISAEKRTDFFTINCNNKQTKHLEKLNALSKKMIPLGFSIDSHTFYTLEQGTLEPSVYGIDFFNLAPPQEHRFPFNKPQKIIYCKDNIITSKESDGTLTIGSFSLKDGNYIELLERQNNDSNTYKLIDSAISLDGKYYALAIWHSSLDNIEGLTEVLIYDYNSGNLIKTSLFSYGNDLSLKISHDKNILAVKTIVLNESGKRIPNIHYLNFDDLQITNCILTDELPYDFELLWADGGKNFIKTDKNLYILKSEENNNILTAKSIFDKNSLSFDIDEFIPSPSGKRLILVRYAIGTNLKSDAWISNIDGTSPILLIEPEGRRKLERFYLYNYLKNCKQVLNDLFSIFSK